MAAQTGTAERIELDEERYGAGAGPVGYSAFRDGVVWAFAGVALLVQIAYVIAVDVPLGAGDQIDYINAGHNIVNWWVTPGAEMQRMPGYPIALSAAYHLGLHDGGIQIAQALLLALGAVGVADIARTLGGRAPARVAAGIYAIYLPLLSFSSVLLTEALEIALLLGATVCTLRAARRTAAWLYWVVAAAALMAMALLVRSDALLFVVALTATLVLTAGARGRRVGAVAIVLAALCVTMGPWVGRNLAFTRHPHPFGTTGKYPAAIGVHLPFDREVGKFATYNRSVRFWSGTRSDGFTPALAAMVKPREELFENIKERPGELLVTRAIGQAQLWVWPVDATIQYGHDDGVPYVPMMVLHLAILLAALVAFFRYRGVLAVRVTASLVLLIAGLHLVTFPQPRYALPVMPLLIAVAAPVLVDAYRRVARR
jgi:4-amino-4-deoxy-L-arabinose transferase-like glycosyltransferase